MTLSWLGVEGWCNAIYLVGCLMVKTVFLFSIVVLIATYVYKIHVYTSCLKGAEELGTLMVYYFPKWCIFKTVDTIKGPPRVRIISFDISRVSSALFRWGISFYGSNIFPLLTYISKLPCFVFMFRYGPRHCLSGPWFRWLSAKNTFPLLLYLLSLGDGFFHIVC